MKRLPWTVPALAAAVLLAGCGEIKNTLTPPAGTANLVTVDLGSAPNFTQVGLFEAEALGYFRQSDLKVSFTTSSHPLSAIANKSAQVAISNEPAMIIVRNTHTSLAAVAAILQGPQRVQVSCGAASTTKTSAKAASKAGTTGTRTSGQASTSTTTTASTTSTPRAHPPLHPARCTTKTIAEPESRYAKAPTYNGLNLVVTEDEIVDHAPILRRFVQAVGRGYAAARADPQSAAENLVKLNPKLNYTAELAGVKASLANFFPAKTPTTDHPWGWETVSQWNAFGYWMLTHHIISDPDAVPDADTNELLAGQGV
jgi:ABC-type nitrate/sulfonate/bicarbonate transport system substrate-binding protein